MAAYQVELTARARSSTKRLTVQSAVASGEALALLANDPASAQVKALTGHDDLLRIRVGAWRVIYRVDHTRVLILVIEIGHRSTVYRRR